ncbi:MAG: hypothetical protein AAEI08_03600, partial [Gammaproteobacteria bacterium]
MGIMAFNQGRINNLKPRKERYRLSDDNLLIDVRTTGQISYYAYIDRKQIFLGRHPQVTIRQAKRKKDSLYNDHYMGKLEATKETFAEFVRSKEFTDWSKGSRTTHEARMASMERTILPILGKVKLAKLDKGDVTKFKNARKATGVAVTTINRELNDISAVLTQARELGVIHHRVKIEKYREDRGKERRVLEEWEVRALREAASSNEGLTPRQIYQKKHIPLIIDAALFCGLRTGEILELEWGDIVHRGHLLEKLQEELQKQGSLSDDEGKALLDAKFSDHAFSVRGETTKTQQTRLVPIAKKLAKDLFLYYGRNEGMKSHDWLMNTLQFARDLQKDAADEGNRVPEKDFNSLIPIAPEHKNKRIFPFTSVKEAFGTARKKAGLSKDITLRSLRHH